MSQHGTPKDKRTTVSDATRDEERREANMTASPGEMPTEEESRAADRNDVDPAVAASNKEAAERGARQKGEGRIEG